jgi:hypothetical protein
MEQVAYSSWAAIFLGDICLPLLVDFPQQADLLPQGFISHNISLWFYWFQ